MSRFDRSRSNFIEQTVEEEIKEIRTGKVIRVYEHLLEDDGSNFEVDAKTDAGTRLERAAPIANTSSDSISIPKVGDTVLIGFLAGDSEDPVVIGTVNTASDRAPLGVAGLRRDVVESGSSPAGSGDLEVNKYTEYDQNVAFEDKDTATPQEAYVQITKGDDDEPRPSESREIPAKVEFYDSPADGEAHISVEINKVGGADSDATYGFKFDMSDGSFQVVDSSGFGIESDGNGNFDWHHKTIDFKEVSGSTGPLDL